MQHASNPLVTMYNTQLEASRRFAEAVFSGTEKIDRVMRGATQSQVHAIRAPSGRHCNRACSRAILTMP